MVENFGLSDRYLGRMVKRVGEQFALPLQLKEVSKTKEQKLTKKMRSQILENYKSVVLFKGHK